MHHQQQVHVHPRNTGQRKLQSLIQCVCSHSSQHPTWGFLFHLLCLRYQSLTNQSAHSLLDSHMPGSHLKRCLEEFLSPPTRVLPPPLTEIPHLAWKADVLPKGKKTGLGGVCVRKKMLSCHGTCCCPLGEHDFRSRAVMITPTTSLLSWAPLPIKMAVGPQFWPASQREIYQQRP